MSPLRFRLQAVIDAAGTSQSELSRRSGVSFATISRMCRNVTGQVSLEILERLADALGVEPSALLNRMGTATHVDADGTQWVVEERFRRATTHADAERPSSYIEFRSGTRTRRAATPFGGWTERLDELFAASVEQESEGNGPLRRCVGGTRHGNQRRCHDATYLLIPRDDDADRRERYEPDGDFLHFVGEVDAAGQLIAETFDGVDYSSHEH
jgi:transcriptional regulator with XRE-family HTH domain